jgi:hypothetical protein
MMSIAASIQVSDTCDDSPMVELESIICNEPDNGFPLSHSDAAIPFRRQPPPGSFASQQE